MTVDRTVVKLGDEIRIRTDRVPKRWSGEITVNNFTSRFPVNSALYRIRATRQNGFTTSVPTDLLISLKNSAGREIPIARGGWIRIVVEPTAFQAKPDSDEFPAEGGEGRIDVAAPVGVAWAPRGVPGWITLAGGGSGGREVIRYRVAENASHRQRSATVAIGDASVVVTQWGSPYVLIPFQTDFKTAPVPVWELPPITARSESEPPWVLDDHSGEQTSVTPAGEGPEGGRSLAVETQTRSDEAWKTQIWLPGLKTRTGARYQASLWLKAETPSTVGLEFGRRMAPNHLCGLSKTLSATTSWKKFTAAFRVEGEGCGPEGNRFAIQVGRVAGKLWIANFSFAEE